MEFDADNGWGYRIANSNWDTCAHGDLDSNGYRHSDSCSHRNTFTDGYGDSYRYHCRYTFTDSNSYFYGSTNNYANTNARCRPDRGLQL